MTYDYDLFLLFPKRVKLHWKQAAVCVCVCVCVRAQGCVRGMRSPRRGAETAMAIDRCNSCWTDIRPRLKGHTNTHINAHTHTNTHMHPRTQTHEHTHACALSLKNKYDKSLRSGVECVIYLLHTEIEQWIRCLFANASRGDTHTHTHTHTREKKG